MEVYDAFSRSLDAFFSQRLEEKAKFATLYDDSTYSPNQYHGYSRMEGLKEQYMIRLCGEGAKLLLPGSYPTPSDPSRQSPHFGEHALALYEQLDQTCRQHLKKVCDKLSLPHSAGDKLLDPVNIVHSSPLSSVTSKLVAGSSAYHCSTHYAFPSYVGSCLLDVFHYDNTFKHEDGSHGKFKNNHLSHSDSGILTLVPCADVPGLEVSDQSRGSDWIALEQLIHRAHPNMGHRQFATIFWGDSVEYLTKTQAKACMHRVAKSEAARHSIVFKQRTYPIATAPRYQEDYDLASIQLSAIDAVQGKRTHRMIMYGIIAAGLLAVGAARYITD